MDGFGAAIKTCVKNVIAYHPNAVIDSTVAVFQHLNPMNVVLATYNSDDVKHYSAMYPKPICNLVIMKGNNFWISEVHEILMHSTDDNMISWKCLSYDPDYVAVRMVEEKVYKPKRKKKLKHYI